MLIDEATRQKMVDFADQYLGEWKFKGDEIIPELCPFCHGGSGGHDRRTFALSTDKGVYVCKRGSCGVHGTFPMLVKELTGEEISVPRVSRVLSSKKKTEYVLPDTKLSPPSDKIYEYFQKRGISRETVDAFKIAQDPDGMIVFSFFRDGVNVFQKFRRPWKPTPAELQQKGKEWRVSNTESILYNMDGIDLREPVVICEGQCDALALYEAGIHNVVSVPSGADDLGWIEHCWDWLERVKTFILFGDNDPPGQKMVRELIKRLGESRCMVVDEYPPVPGQKGAFCKDANEILLRYNGFELIDMVENAAEVPIRGVLNLADVEDEDPANVPTVRTNIPDLDMCTGGLTQGGLTIMTGKTGEGKSTLSGLLLANAIEQGHSVCAYSGELKASRFKNWIDFQIAGSDWIGLKYNADKRINVPYIDKKVLQRIHDWYRDKFWLFDNNELFEEDESSSILQVFTEVHRRYGCDVFLVDNMMTALSDSDEEFRAQTKFIKALKKFANHYNVHVLVVAHPRKTRAEDKLTAQDVAGSSNVTNLADVAMAIEHPDIRIIKNREGSVKKLIECCYCGDSRRIYQASAGDKNKFSWDKTGLTKPNPRADSMVEYQVSLSDVNGSKSPF